MGTDSMAMPSHGQTPTEHGQDHGMAAEEGREHEASQVHSATDGRHDAAAHPQAHAERPAHAAGNEQMPAHAETPGHAEMPAHEAMHDMPEAMMDMSSTLLPSLPMTRDGSGTSWIPDTSPMHAVHSMAGGWNLMFHGLAFLRYTSQDAFDSGTRGNSTVDLPNWFMVMARRPAVPDGRDI